MARRLNQIDISSDYMVRVEDEYIEIDASAGTVIATLPTPELIDAEIGKEYIFYLRADDLGSGFRGVVKADGGALIEGDVYFLMYTNENLKVVYTGNTGWQVVHSNMPYRFKTFNHKLLNLNQSIVAPSSFREFDQFPAIYTIEWGWHIVHLTAGVYEVGGRGGAEWNLFKTVDDGLPFSILDGESGEDYCNGFEMMEPIDPCSRYFFATDAVGTPAPLGWYHTFIIKRMGVPSV